MDEVQIMAKRESARAIAMVGYDAYSLNPNSSDSWFNVVAVVELVLTSEFFLPSKIRIMHSSHNVNYL